MDFKKQIEEDIQDYQERYSSIANMNKPEWAFNFWILDKLFSVDEDLIENQIVDYNDVGVDAYDWHEDTHDLYIIQNKYYSEGTNLSVNYIENDFLIRPINSLENETYRRSPELQKIFTKFKDEEDFAVHLFLYVTNNSSKTKNVEDAIEKFNSDNLGNRYSARVYWLNDIQDLYYDEPLEKKKSLKYEIESINNGTVINIDSGNYGMEVAIDAKYVCTPILNLYDLYRKADRDNYPIFDANIRDYLGTSGAVNKGIAATLSSEDRNNFFYYNNGITMIVKKIGKPKTKTRDSSTYLSIEITDPQIVNGCQTVSTIYETLSALPESKLRELYHDTFVMLKILEIPKDTEEYQKLSEDIVKYNNSQNALSPKWFESSSSEFKRIQIEFLNRGFLVCIKQSDKRSFSVKYKSPSELIKLNQQLLDRFKIKHNNKAKDFMIDLEKLLQVFLAFSDSYEAINHKSKLLKSGAIHDTVIKFIKNPNCTINDKLNLLLLYMRLDQERSADKKGYNPFMIIHCFGKYICDGDVSKIGMALSNPESIDKIIKYFSQVLKSYYIKWAKVNPNMGYNDYIKTPLDFDKLKDDIQFCDEYAPAEFQIR